VRCKYNSHNRPFDEQWCRALAQDILNRHWKDNGETIVIGKTGRVLSGQHRLIGLVLAGQRWSSDRQGKHWRQLWINEPVMDTTIQFGVDESPETVRTLDNTKPRTLADVLFTDAAVFGRLKRNERTPLCRMLQNCVRMLWSRTGARDDPFAPMQTHSEALEFLNRHDHVKKAVKTIWDIYKPSPQACGKRMAPGYASALLYLMGCSSSNGDEYRAADTQSEKKLKWSSWERAVEFWEKLNDTEDGSLEPARKALAGLVEKDSLSVGSLPERMAILIKAWGVFVEGGNPETRDLKLHRETDDQGVVHLLDQPTIGGIDLGAGKRAKKKEEGEPVPQESENGEEVTEKSHLEEVKGRVKARQNGEVDDDNDNDEEAE